MTLVETLPRATGFDFLVGEWTVQNRRLREPLSGRTDWYTTEATATSRTLHNGAISVDEMWYPELGFAGTSFRIFSRAEGTWTIYWVNSDNGTLQAPVVGGWDAAGDRFTADGPDEYAGREILARYLWHQVTPVSATWEQSFSLDGGVTWETNWVMDWQRATA